MRRHDPSKGSGHGDKRVPNSRCLRKTGVPSAVLQHFHMDGQ